ncbi:BTB/POZ domain-containing protein 7 [Anoplophora glabripennis]|uniref:BTB/POZ domain-containing protein 7 n=1 Tax=Anoplophora glabripennis TaxID=217634 RepID=UPI0008741B5D|nr:BTB/POZ domain-containing protein 7 [Anoplophora glabripennis]XP_018571312.1 BTB/POZ domain-containing protein 7 [Anoplophora glabripennis]
MNLFSCLFPCALQHSWRSGENQQCMSERLTHRMGVNASTSPGNDPTMVPANLGNDSSVTGYRDTIGVVRERKKKVTGFATLKKKFIRRRRSSKACDHGRMLRELVADWSPLEVAALLEEYEALAALKDLCVQAELARPPAATFKQDLSALYDFKYCTDADLVYRGACFPIHRALLSARCPYFRDLLAGCPGYGARICLELRTATVDVQLFSALLRYLYTGDICPHNTNIDMNLLRRLREEFGTPNALEADLRYLLETGDYADAALVFTSDGSDCQRPDSGSSEYGFRPKLELPCHKAILSARSPFFRNLLQRRSKSGEDHTERALHIPTRIVLDETVIPKRYARVLLHAIYLDQVDLSLISRGGCGGGLGEAQALAHTGRARPSPLEEAMELYQIGRFLELDILSQGCEDLILEWLSLDTLPVVLQWARQPHGSAWVHRQALHFLREEFQPVSQSSVLHQLDKVHLIEVLRSPFLQASELEVLHAVLKWGENELVRRMEDREPNIVSHTAHSVARKGIKKRDLSDVELREILSDLLPLVRMDHVLPPNSEILNHAIRRGLVSTPPSHMIGGDRENLRVNAWIRGGKNNGLFIQPRLFMPYYDEVKVLVEDQLVQEVEIMRMRRARYMQDIPDTLYMVEEKPRPHGAAGVDVLASVLPVPDPAVMTAMLKREQKLRQSPSCQRALNMPLSSRHEINRQIRLRVVREFNLPDPVADMLENCFCIPDQCDTDSLQISPNKVVVGSSHSCYSKNVSSQRAGYSQRQELPAIVPDGDFRFSTEPESSSCSDGHLSDIMPDVAMATATIGQIQLQEQQEMELDLGDGNPRIHSSLGGTQLIPSLQHPLSYRRYQPSTYPHLRSDSQSQYNPPMPRFL